MANLYDKASLVQIPSGYKDGKLYNIKPFDQPFEFERGSSATRVNEDGLIETFYNEATNLLLQSNNFDTTWTTDNYARLYTPTSGILGYDGTSDGWLLDILGDTTSQNIRQSLSSSGVQTFSVYAKANTLDWMLLYVSAGTLTRGYFDIANGTLGSSNNLINSKITDAGNGWYRCSITFNEAITSVRVYLANASNSIQQSSGSIYVQDAQLEAGYFATPYIETTAETVTRPNRHDTPRIDYTNGKALLLEPQRTNNILKSEDITNANLVSCNFEAGYLAPDGSNNAVRFYCDPSDKNVAYLTIGANNSTLPTDSRSIYAKTVSGTGTTNLCSYYQNTNNNFTLTEEWQRFELSGTTTTSGQYNFYGVDFRRGSTTLTEVILWAPQVEQGSYATSYIPTNGSAETRLADVCTGGGDSTIFNDEEGVLFVEMAALADDGTNRILGISNGGIFDNSIMLRFQSNSNIISAQVRLSGVYQCNLNFTNTDATQFNKVAFKYKENDFALWVNGVEVDADNSGSLVTGLNELAFDFVVGNVFYGKVKSLLYFDRALTDTELQTLTTI